MRVLVALLALFGASMLAGSAAAQVQLNGAPIHSGTNHPNNASPLMISQADCNDPTTFTFAVTGLTAQKTLSVWASSQGGDCTQQSQRNPGSTQTCYEVMPAFIPTEPPSASIALASSAIVGGSGSGGASGVSGCDDSTAGDAPRTLVLYFLIDEASGDVTDSVTYDIDFDLRGPPPPTNLAPSTFDESVLLVKYCSPAGTTDVAGYKLYCDPSGATGDVSSSADPVCTSTSTSATTSTTTTSGAGGSSGTSGVGGSSTDASVSASSSVASSSASGGETSTCTSSAFSAGQAADNLVECATVSGLTAVSAQAPGFTVGTLGAVAIAAFDNVGNLGPLSTVVCGQTEEVTDFFEDYRNSGGTAGDGCYCGVVHGSPSRIGAAAFMLGLALIALRRVRGAR